MCNYSAVLTAAGYEETQTAREFSRIISAAVINRRFCEMLLSNPEGAIRNGFSGESFDLKEDDRIKVSSIHANTLSEFAAQLSQS